MKIFITLCFAILTSTMALATTPQSDEVATLIHLEHTWQKAILAGNKRVLRNILAPRYLDTSYKNTLRTKTEVLDATDGPKKYNAFMSNLKVRIFGSSAIVTGLNNVTGPQGAWTAKLRFTDVFVKQNNGWQVVGSQENLVHTASRAPSVNHQ